MCVYVVLCGLNNNWPIKFKGREPHLQKRKNPNYPPKTKLLFQEYRGGDRSKKERSWWVPGEGMEETTNRAIEGSTLDFLGRFWDTGGLLRLLWFVQKDPKKFSHSWSGFPWFFDTCDDLLFLE